MKFFSIAILMMLGLFACGIWVTPLQAQPLDAGAPLVVDAGAPVAQAPTAPVLHDPLSNSAAALNDLRQAKRQGWALLAFAVLVMATRIGVIASARYKSLAWLAKGRTHLALAAVATFALTAYNDLALGGSLYAAIIAAGGVALYAVLPQPKQVNAATAQQ